MSRSTKRFQCSTRHCSVRFNRLHDKRRHEQEFHGGKNFCAQPGCNYRGTKRLTTLRKHMRINHPFLFNVELTIPTMTRPESSGCSYSNIIQGEGSTPNVQTLGLCPLSFDLDPDRCCVAHPSAPPQWRSIGGRATYIPRTATSPQILSLCDLSTYISGLGWSDVQGIALRDSYRHPDLALETLEAAQEMVSFGSDAKNSGSITGMGSIYTSESGSKRFGGFEVDTYDEGIYTW